MPCPATLSMTLQSEILSTQTSNFLKQIIFLILFNLILKMAGKTCRTPPCFSTFSIYRGASHLRFSVACIEDEALH